MVASADAKGRSAFFRKPIKGMRASFGKKYDRTFGAMQRAKTWDRTFFKSDLFRMGVQPATNHFLSPCLLTYSTGYQHNNYRKHDSEERRSYDVNQESARTTVS
jgi:hypothetical protein